MGTKITQIKKTVLTPLSRITLTQIVLVILAFITLFALFSFMRHTSQLKHEGENSFTDYGMIISCVTSSVGYLVLAVVGLISFVKVLLAGRK